MHPHSADDIQYAWDFLLRYPLWADHILRWPGHSEHQLFKYVLHNYKELGLLIPRPINKANRK